MAAGLPGVGLSGVFFIISALVAVPLELVRTVRGESSLSRWANVSRHFALAILMIAALELFYALLRLTLVPITHALPLLSHGLLVGVPASTRTQVHMMPVLPVVSTIGLVALVMAIAKAAELVARARRQTAAASARSVNP